MGHSGPSEPLEERYLPVTWLKAGDLYTCSDGAHLPPSEQQALHLVPAPDPTAILRNTGYLGPSFASLGTGWGSGPHVG